MKFVNNRMRIIGLKGVELRAVRPGDPWKTMPEGEVRDGTEAARPAPPDESPTFSDWFLSDKRCFCTNLPTLTFKATRPKMYDSRSMTKTIKPSTALR